jgi:voltage-gated potassium channel
VPHTVAGKFIATLTALMGVCVVALLTGIVATGFTNQVAMRRHQLEAEISSALSDGVITSDERQKIDDLRQRLNISEEDALAIISYLERRSDEK